MKDMTNKVIALLFVFGVMYASGARAENWDEAIMAKGREKAAALGNPVDVPRWSTDTIGAYQWYERGVVMWSFHSGAHEIHGAIIEKWKERGSEFGIGYPMTDETTAPDGVGRYSWFEASGGEGSAIYWHPDLGAFAVYGDILKSWAANGYERGFGYPTTDEHDGTSVFCGLGTREQCFGHFKCACWYPSTRQVIWP